MRFVTGILLIAPLIAAIPAPTPAPAPYTTAVAIYARQTTSPLLPLPGPPDDEDEEDPPPASSSSSSARPSSSSSTAPPSSSSSEQESSSSSTPPPSSSSSTRRLSTSSTEVISTSRDSEGNEQVVTLTRVQTVVAPSESPSQSSKPKEKEDGGIPVSGIIGLSVAGGIAVLAVIGFIVWKMTSKRFSHFDDDDAPINWDKEPAVVVAPSRPAPSITTAASSVDLSRDPYAVPPMPQNSGYKDDSSFYDPYRGPVPGTFATPPASTDGHGQWHAGGEAIQMNTYPTRTTSPGPNLAYKDPFAGSVRSASPGPNLAYGDPMNRTGTPVQRLGTPGYGLPGDISRTGTPAGGYGQAGFGQDITRMGTPGAQSAYGQDITRMGTPGAQSAYGHDINRMGTPGGVAPGYRGPSPGPNMAYGGGQNPYANYQ